MFNVLLQPDPELLQLTVYNNTTISEVHQQTGTLINLLKERLDELIASSNSASSHGMVVEICVYGLPPMHVLLNIVSLLLQHRPLLDTSIRFTTIRVKDRAVRFILKKLIRMHHVEAVTIDEIKNKPYK